MWPQQQQQTQYSTIAFDNGNVLQSNSANGSHPQQVEKTLDTSFKRQAEGPILWFAGPPLNTIPDKKPLHSVTYLNWKKAQSSSTQ